MLNEKNIRELCYIVKIDAINPLPGYDRVESAVVGGWRIIVKKGQFKPGDYGVYFEIDSKVPAREPFMFLEPKKFKIKTQKMCKSISQGLLMALDDFGDEPWVLGIKARIAQGKNVEHEFLTEVLGVTYAEAEDNTRKAKSADKYKLMAQRKPQLFKKSWAKWMMRREWGRRVMFLLFGRKKDKATAFPSHFPFVRRTDQERCLIAQTKILTDQGLIHIGKIVNQKLPVKVLSMNPDGTTSFKKIVDYQKFDNPGGEVVTLEYPYKVGNTRLNHLCCTLDHKIYTQRGYVEAKDLKAGDCAYMPVEAYDEEVIPAIYGMLLGDSHIYNDKRSNGLLRVIATNGEKQLDYLKYKKSLFNDGEGGISNAGVGSYENSKPTYHYFLPVDPYIDKNLREDIYKDGKKKITKNVLNKLTEVSLAFWYMDDGSISYRDGEKQRPQIRMNTQGFSKEENELLSECLNTKFGISCHVTEEKRKDKPVYYHIYIDVNGTPKFLKMITPYMCRSMAYKTLPELESVIETKKPSYHKINMVMPVPILDIKLGQHKNKTLPSKFPYVYDIEVEDNHNFIADGIVVHNCENMMPWLLEDKTPYIKTQKCDGSSGTYILERKKHGRFEFYVCSRNVRQLNEKQQSYYEENYYWEVAKKYKIEECLKDYLKDHPELDYICWQGEVCSPKIQGNPHKLTETHFYAFHMIDSKIGKWDIREAVKVWESYGIEHVPIVDENYILPDDFEEFKLSADTYYDKSVCEGQIKCEAEGFVYYKTTDPNFSFKNVSRKYLLKR